MNKGFFVVFLGIVIGAMSLIFFNQALTPSAPVQEQAVAAAPKASSKPVQTPDAPTPQVRRELVLEAPHKPVASTSEPAKPIKPVATTAKPEPVKPVKPVAIKPEPAKPAELVAPVIKPEPVKPAETVAATVKPRAARAEEPKSESEKAASPAVSDIASRTVSSGNSAVAPTAPAENVPLSAEAAATAKPEASSPDPAPQKPDGKKTLTLRNIGLQLKNNGVALRIEADRPFSYKTFVLPKPDRYVVDLIGAWDNMRTPAVPPNMLIKSIRAGKQAGGPRLVMDLQRVPKQHNVVWISPTVLEIQIE